MSFSRRGCYKCGNVGHFAEACPEAERLCYNCKQPGHESNACPQPRTTDAKQCYHCGGIGHVQADCPSVRVSSSGPGARCYTCGKPGHIARNCTTGAGRGAIAASGLGAPSPAIIGGPPAIGAGRGGGSRIICYKCGGFNHFARDCQAGGVKCYNCGKFGHISKECNTVGGGPIADKSAKTCYRCGEIGHISRDCPNAQTAVPANTTVPVV